MPLMMPVYKPGENVPARASAAVTGGHFVTPTGVPLTKDGAYPIAHTGAGLWALGVAERDAIATGAQNDNRSMVNVVRAGVARVIAGAAVAVTTAPVAVKSDATGRAIGQGGTGVILGYALSAAATAGDIIEVALV